MATIIAMVCFAFVQPMPEHTTRESGEVLGFAELLAPDNGNVSESPPFVDTAHTGKTFSPLIKMSSAPEWHIGAPRGFQQAATLPDLRNPPPDPLIRPG